MNYPNHPHLHADELVFRPINLEGGSQYLIIRIASVVKSKSLILNRSPVRDEVRVRLEVVAPMLAIPVKAPLAVAVAVKVVASLPRPRYQERADMAITRQG